MKGALRNLRLISGFGFMVAFAVLCRPTNLSILAALPFLVLGLALRGWAAGHLTKRKKLTVTGPYAHTQSPLYLGSLALLIGGCIGARTLWLPLIFLPLYAAIHAQVIKAEREENLRSFGGPYQQYAANVSLFVPKLKGYRALDKKRFSARLYLKNGEYNALIGVLLALLLLYFRRRA